MIRHTMLWAMMFLLSAIATISRARGSEARVGKVLDREALGGEVALAPVFVSDDPKSIYAADPNDSWNRIFRALFTRTVNVRVSDAFREGAPFVPFQIDMGPLSLGLSKAKLSRIEVGDRAIEPLYPTFFSAKGVTEVLSDPLYSELTTALQQAIDENETRSSIERALMQADVWAAYDILYGAKPRGIVGPERRTKLVDLLRQFIHKLALTRDEIKSLKSNYSLAVSGNKLPDVFVAESGWLEVELGQDRLHDAAANFRRAARVFVKPRLRPSDADRFVESLKFNRNTDQIEAVALVVQNLLIDRSGRVVPAPLFADVQFRFFKKDPFKKDPSKNDPIRKNDRKTDDISADARQFELSRRKLLTEPLSGGFVEYSETSPAYLTSAGNDYDFATPIDKAGAPIVVPLRTRCAQCHNRSLTTNRTFAIHDFPPVPTARILTPSNHDRALYVAQRKEERADFKSLSTAQ